MEKQFLMRPNQHVKSSDFSSMQAYTRASLDHVVNDGIDDGRKYYGLETTKTGPTETTTAIGRLYSSGAVFVKEVQAVFSHIAKLPAVTEKIATIVVWGLEVE